MRKRVAAVVVTVIALLAVGCGGQPSARRARRRVETSPRYVPADGEVDYHSSTINADGVSEPPASTLDECNEAKEVFHKSSGCELPTAVST